MAFRRSDLQEAFFVPGTHAFRVFGYGTADPLGELLGPGYLAPRGRCSSRVISSTSPERGAGAGLAPRPMPCAWRS